MGSRARAPQIPHFTCSLRLGIPSLGDRISDFTHIRPRMLSGYLSLIRVDLEDPRAKYFRGRAGTMEGLKEGSEEREMYLLSSTKATPEGD